MVLGERVTCPSQGTSDGLKVLKRVPLPMATARAF